MNVIIMRGISGSGKTTWVKKNYPSAMVASADHAFLNPDGTYEFNPAKLHEAHIKCYQTFIRALIKGEPRVIVDNTNVHVWEITPYVMPAQSFGYEVEILTIECDPSIALERKNLLSAEKVRSMAKRLTEEEKKFPDFLRSLHRKI